MYVYIYIYIHTYLLTYTSVYTCIYYIYMDYIYICTYRRGGCGACVLATTIFSGFVCFEWWFVGFCVSWSLVWCMCVQCFVANYNYLYIYIDRYKCRYRYRYIHSRGVYRYIDNTCLCMYVYIYWAHTHTPALYLWFLFTQASRYTRVHLEANKGRDPEGFAGNLTVGTPELPKSSDCHDKLFCC